MTVAATSTNLCIVASRSREGAFAGAGAFALFVGVFIDPSAGPHPTKVTDWRAANIPCTALIVMVDYDDVLRRRSARTRR
jgi:hypothetical protein